MSMPPLIAMTRTQHEALEHALDHLRRSASAAGCVPGECQHVARRLRAEIAILERLMELALVREASGADVCTQLGAPGGHAPSAGNSDPGLPEISAPLGLSSR